MMILKSMFENDKNNSSEDRPVLIEEKLKKILELCCKILDIEHGGAFFAVNYQNREDVNQQNDIAIVSEYKTDDDQEMDSDSFTSNSFLHHVFNGVTEHTTEKPLSTFEVTIDDEGFHHFRKNNQLTYDNTLHFSEFQDKLYSNIFYLRITEIIEIEGDGWETIPQAVLGFYSNPLDEEASKAFCARQEAAIENRKKQLSSRDTVLKKDYKRPYQRFDPKKVRQLLLLRNDMSDFVNHHLNNDSLRAYIHMINNTKFSTSLKHGIGIYERLFETYTERLNHYAKTVNSQVENEIKEGTGFIRTIFSYLTNKMHLISLANDAVIYKNYDPDDFYQEIKVRDVVEEFKKVKGFIFQLEQDNIKSLSDEEIFFDADSISGANLDVTFKIFPKLLNELVFEVLYNIKKHAVHDSRTRINKNNPLEIRVFTTLIDYTLYLCVSNNYLIMTPRYIRQLNAKLSRQKGVDGLNLIYNIFDKTIGKKLIIDAEEGYFNVNIPIKPIKQNENTDN